MIVQWSELIVVAAVASPTTFGRIGTPPGRRVRHSIWALSRWNVAWAPFIGSRKRGTGVLRSRAPCALLRAFVPLLALTLVGRGSRGVLLRQRSIMLRQPVFYAFEAGDQRLQ